MQAQRDGAIDEIEFLARSENRVQLFNAIRTEGRIDRTELNDGLDISRTTVTRNLDALEEHGWVTSTNGEYAMTCLGELVAEEFFELLESMRVAVRLKEFVRWLPEEFDADLRWFDDAEITFADETDPYAPVRKHAEGMDSAETFRGLLPAIGIEPMKSAHKQVQNGSKHEIVIEEGIATLLRSDPKYADLFEEMEATEQVRVCVYDDSIPYYLGLADQTVQIGVEDDDGLPRALLETDDPEVLEWAEETYDRYSEGAEPIA